MPEYVKKMIEKEDIQSLIDCGFQKLALKLQESQLIRDLATNPHRLVIVPSIKSKRK